MESDITYGNNIEEQQQKVEITRTIIKFKVFCQPQLEDFKKDKLQQHFRRAWLEMI